MGETTRAREIPIDTSLVEVVRQFDSGALRRLTRRRAAKPAATGAPLLRPSTRLHGPSQERP